MIYVSSIQTKHDIKERVPAKAHTIVIVYLDSLVEVHTVNQMVIATATANCTILPFSNSRRQPHTVLVLANIVLSRKEVQYFHPNTTFG